MTLCYIVTQRCTATSAISGRERLFEPGDKFYCDNGQHGATLTIELESSLYLMEWSTFETGCCKFKNEGL